MEKQFAAAPYWAVVAGEFWEARIHSPFASGVALDPAMSTATPDVQGMCALDCAP